MFYRLRKQPLNLMLYNLGEHLKKKKIYRFDQQLFEDRDINAMQEALELFQKTINNEWFWDKPIVCNFFATRFPL